LEGERWAVDGDQPIGGVVGIGVPAVGEQVAVGVSRGDHANNNDETVTNRVIEAGNRGTIQW